jgi:hypothetical protein
MTAERSLRLDQVTQYLPTGKTDPTVYLPATLKEPDLPQVKSNLNESPQEYLVVTVECIEV